MKPAHNGCLCGRGKQGVRFNLLEPAGS